MVTNYYRYITDVQERNQLVSERKVHSRNSVTGHETWFSPSRYDNPLAAQQQLALPAPILPIYRVGPIPEAAIENLTIGPRRVQPAFGQPGGGLEIATKSPVWLLGLWSFGLNNYDAAL
ncbi:MAG: hypothetical protein WCI11_07880 [Candidatus Methylumidiphilus sp.]